MIKNFVPIILVISLMVLATLACAEGPSAKQIWTIQVWAGSRGGLTRATFYYCESYNVDATGALTITNCGKSNFTKTFSASQKWEISQH